MAEIYKKTYYAVEEVKNGRFYEIGEMTDVNGYKIYVTDITEKYHRDTKFVQIKGKWIETNNFVLEIAKMHCIIYSKCEPLKEGEGEPYIDEDRPEDD